jgi:hypothetical protein
LPPPTTNTGWPRVSAASLAPAPLHSPGALEALLVLQAEPAVGHASRADRGTGDDLGAILQVRAHLVRGAVGAHSLVPQQDLGAEALHLLARTLGQFGAADAIWKTQVILDPRATAGLAAQGIALNQYRFQALGGAVDGRAQAGWASTVDCQIVFGAQRGVEPAELLGDTPNGWALQAGAIGEDADRQSRIGQMLYASLRARLRVGQQRHPLKRHIAAVQEVADRVTQR